MRQWRRWRSRSGSGASSRPPIWMRNRTGFSGPAGLIPAACFPGLLLLGCLFGCLLGWRLRSLLLLLDFLLLQPGFLFLERGGDRLLDLGVVREPLVLRHVNARAEPLLVLLPPPL